MPGTTTAEQPLPWYADGSVWDGADMWATEEESTDHLVGLYRAAWEHSDRNVEELDLDAPATVSWWAEGERDTDLGTLLVRVLADTARHAGQADIVRELIDGRGGSDQESFGDEQAWRSYVERIERAADAFPVSPVEPTSADGDVGRLGAVLAARPGRSGARARSATTCDDRRRGSRP